MEKCIQINTKYVKGDFFFAQQKILESKKSRFWEAAPPHSKILRTGLSVIRCTEPNAFENTDRSVCREF